MSITFSRAELKKLETLVKVEQTTLESLDMPEPASLKSILSKVEAELAAMPPVAKNLWDALRNSNTTDA